MTIIDRFTNEYEFLSMDYPLNLELYEITFPTLSNYYFAFKSNFLQLLQKVAVHERPEWFIDMCHEKHAHEYIAYRSDWEDVRFRILQYGIYRKFSEEPCRSKLLEIPKNTPIIYGFADPNPTKEKLYLGQSLVTGEGENTYGRMIAAHKLYIETQNIHQSLNSTYVRSTQ